MQKIIIITLLFNGLDFITGITAGYKKTKKICSTKLREGLFKKAGFIFCYCLAYLLVTANYFVDLEIPKELVSIICGYTIFAEVISIIENISVLNDSILPNKIIKLIGGKKND